MIKKIKNLISKLIHYLLLRRISKKTTKYIAAGFVIFICTIGILADILASEKPLLAKIDGQLYILPTFYYTPELIDLDNHNIAQRISPGKGWAFIPPVPYGPNQGKVNGVISWLSPPGRIHLLGTDGSGRDVLSRLIHGARSAMFVGVGSMIICTILGVFLGAVSAFLGGMLDKVTSAAIETLTAFPSLFLILGIQGLLGITSLWQLVLIIGATRWTDVARITRSEVLRISNEEYVDAARALGLTNFRILTKHILPSAMGPIMVAATFGISSAIMIESTLSFLGYGAPPTEASWGQLLADAFLHQESYWLYIFPGLILSLTVLAINITGESIGESLDIRR